MHAGRARPEQHAVADRLQLRDVLGRRARPRHRADAVVLADEHELLAAHHQVRRADAKLGVHDRVARAQLELLRALAHAAVADRLHRACARQHCSPLSCNPVAVQAAAVPAGADSPRPRLGKPRLHCSPLSVFATRFVPAYCYFVTAWCLAVPARGLLWFTFNSQPLRQVGAV